MTAEHRDTLVKLVAKEAEKARAAVRNHRQAILKELKRVGEHASQDDVKRLEKAVRAPANPMALSVPA
jgi:ribosome recycling factor